MTDVQKKQIELMRLQGLGYSKISKCMSLSINTVKSYCRRNQLDSSLETLSSEKQQELSRLAYCKFCGTEIVQHEKRKKRTFCNKSCRTTYWSQNQGEINRTSTVKHQCQHCGKEFSDYAKNSRKYCSRTCYITARFKGGMLCEP